MIDRTMLRSGREPSARVIRDARCRPFLERGDECVLCKLFGQAEVTDNPSDTSDDSGGLDSPDGVDGAMGIGRRHRYPSYAALRTRELLSLGSVLRRREHLADLGLTLPARPVLVMKLHETPRSLDRIFLRLQFKHREPAEDFLGLRERPVGDGNFSSRQPDTGAGRGWAKSAAFDHFTGLGCFFGELVHGVHQFLWWRTRFLGGFDHHHESHCDTSPSVFRFYI